MQGRVLPRRDMSEEPFLHAGEQKAHLVESLRRSSITKTPSQGSI